jgi:hypothetical protein
VDRAKEVSFNRVAVSAAHDPVLMESFCPKCQRSLGASPIPYMLRIVEHAHKCSCDEQEEKEN